MRAGSQQGSQNRSCSKYWRNGDIKDYVYIRKENLVTREYIPATLVGSFATELPAQYAPSESMAVKKYLILTCRNLNIMILGRLLA